METAALSPSLSSFRKQVPPDPPSLNSVVRAVLARGAAPLDGAGISRAHDYAAAAWPNDPTVLMVLRGAVTPTSMSSTALTPIRDQLVAALTPMSAGGQVFGRAGVSLSSF